MKIKLILLISSVIIVASASAGTFPKSDTTKSVKPVKKNGIPTKTSVKEKKIKLNVTAKIILAVKTKGKSSSVGLDGSEKDLTSYLDYNNYQVLKSQSKTLKLKKSFKVRFAQGASVKITPLSENEGRVKVKVVWSIPGQRSWTTTLNFKCGKRSIISGPKKKKGGMYIMSLLITQ